MRTTESHVQHAESIAVVTESEKYIPKSMFTDIATPIENEIGLLQCRPIGPTPVNCN